ncbi:MAG: caspase family protein, partial [Nitriliruptorales bacterium]
PTSADAGGPTSAVAGRRAAADDGVVTVLDPGAANGPAGDAAGGGTASPSAASDPGLERFERRFPAQARASQNAGEDPASARWAVLIGINEYAGRTRDNVGSRQDAEDLHRHLRDLGWYEDHIVLLRDEDATREMIKQSTLWLQRKTTGASFVIVHYSGHTKQWPGRDVDGDGEVPDEAIWPHDNRFIVDSEFVWWLHKVRSRWMWVNIGACEAAGFADAGLQREGRLLTFSSREVEKSYEDPERDNSVWGYYLVDQAMIAGHGDANGDGKVSVEEAFRYAAERAPQRTARASHGPQHPVVWDGVRGDLSLEIPPPPPPSQTESDGDDCTLGVLCPGGRRG